MRRLLPTVDELVTGIYAANRVLLARAITLVESAKEEHQALAQEVIARILADRPQQTNGIRIGISGAPGVGKSTFIEALGMFLVEHQEPVAVLAIDPSSSISHGSILGDKTRMEKLSIQELAFIRPSPAGDSLGGVARKTRETILLVEAAGYRNVLIETVGVGQSEIAVHSMTDIFLLLLLPGAGDELQGIKRGIVEMADILAVNKSDGDRIRLANQARGHYINATHLFPAKPSNWTPQVLACSALEGSGISEIWAAIMDYKSKTLENGYFVSNRKQQALYWMNESIAQGIKELFYKHPLIAVQLPELEKAVLEGSISPFAAAQQLLQFFKKG